MPKTIVWIEDDVDIISPVIRPLERAGYRIICLRTAREVFDNVQKLLNADLILLDMLLPDGGVSMELSRYTGLDIFRELKTKYHLSTPVVALTVVAREEVRDMLRDLGIADIIRKPVRPSELKERIERVLAAP
jgi:CheY-like chemotaxis protein